MQTINTYIKNLKYMLIRDSISRKCKQTQYPLLNVREGKAPVKTRIVSATVLLAVFLSCMVLSPYSRVLFFTVAGIACAYELSKNFEKLDASCSLWVMISYLTASAVLILTGFGTTPLIIAFVASVFLSLLAGILQEKVSGKGAFYTMGGVCYPCMLFVVAMVVSNSDIWMETLALSCIPSWTCDAFALIGGSKLGKHKLCPRVSPNKTVEGSIIGALSSVVAGLAVYTVFHYFYISDISIGICLLTAVLSSSMGQIGDLTESMLKRLLGVKDFSNLIPGHGGLFDRADSIIFSIPTAYYLLILLFR